MTDVVPDGTVQEVVDWVGDDPARAQQALDAERAGQNRTTLIAQLEPIAAKEASAVTETTTPEQQEEIIEPPAPDIVIDVTQEGTYVGPVYRVAVDTDVPDYDDLGQVETIESDPVDYFQVAGNTRGAVISFNGAAYALRADQVAALKAQVDHLMAGLTL